MTTHHLRNLMPDNVMREPGVEPGCLAAPDPKSRTAPTESPNDGRVVRPKPPRTASARPASVTISHTAEKILRKRRPKKPVLPKRSDRVKSDFKATKNATGRARCEVCHWRPPAILREVAGGMVESLLHAHHVLPVACGGADHADNLILVCPTHHAMAHHMGRMSHGAAGTQRDWQGPLNRRELLAAFAVLARPDEYRALAKLHHNVGSYLDLRHAEALPMNAPRWGMTVSRGHSVPLVGRRRFA